MNYERDFAPLMKRMVSAFPQRPIAPDTVAVYWEMLNDIEPSVFAEAVRRCMTTCEWFPTIKHLRHAAEDVVMESIPDPLDAMRRFPHRIQNPMIRTLLTTPYQEARDADPRHLRAQDERPVGFLADPSGLGLGEPDAD